MPPPYEEVCSVKQVDGGESSHQVVCYIGMSRAVILISVHGGHKAVV